MTNIFLSFVEVSILASFIVAMLVLFIPFLSKRYAPKWKYWVWIFLAFRLLIPFNITGAEFVVDTLLQTKSQNGPEYGKDNTDNMSRNNIVSKQIVLEIPEQMTTPVAVKFPKSNTNVTLPGLAALVWIFGSLVYIFVHLISYLHYKKQIIKEGTIIKNNNILHQISGLEQELHIKYTVPAVKFPKASSPMIIGFLKPVLVLPEEQYSQEQLFFILKHEMVHLKRKDVYIKLLFVTANALHWFNPFIWIMQKEAVIDIELSCDERVTQGEGFNVRKAYAETLLSTLNKQCIKRNALFTRFYSEKIL